ncbi:MAG: hypothetical protein ACE5H4_11580 [Candidatus Thorarchaeota archaeon]
MTKIDEIMPELDFFPALIVVIVISMALELSGVWMTMLVAGAVGALFVRRIRRAFLLGFLGVGIAWSLLFAFLVATAQAVDVANFFIGLLGLSGLGVLVIVISLLFGALLGGFGGMLGRALYELIDEFLPSREASQEKQIEGEGEVAASE